MHSSDTAREQISTGPVVRAGAAAGAAAALGAVALMLPLSDPYPANVLVLAASFAMLLVAAWRRASWISADGAALWPEAVAIGVAAMTADERMAHLAGQRAGRGAFTAQMYQRVSQGLADRAGDLLAGRPSEPRAQILGTLIRSAHNRWVFFTLFLVGFLGPLMSPPPWNAVTALALAGCFWVLVTAFIAGELADRRGRRGVDAELALIVALSPDHLARWADLVANGRSAPRAALARVRPPHA